MLIIHNNQILYLTFRIIRTLFSNSKYIAGFAKPLLFFGAKNRINRSRMINPLFTHRFSIIIRMQRKCLHLLKDPLESSPITRNHTKLLDR